MSYVRGFFGLPVVSDYDEHDEDAATYTWLDMQPVAPKVGKFNCIFIYWSYLLLQAEEMLTHFMGKFSLDRSKAEQVFNRPGVAGAVLQSPLSLIN